MHIKNDSPELISTEATFADVKIYMIVPYDETRLLIGTRANGFFLFDGVNARPFATDADDYLREKQLYHGIRLSHPGSTPARFALATRMGGLVIIDSRGKLIRIIDKTYGLQDNSLKYVFEDNLGNLWMGLNNGISRIGYHSPVSIFDERSGLGGLVLSVSKHGGRLFAGTSGGLFLP